MGLPGWATRWGSTVEQGQRCEEGFVKSEKTNQEAFF